MAIVVTLLFGWICLSVLFCLAICCAAARPLSPWREEVAGEPKGALESKPALGLEPRREAPLPVS